MMIKFYFCNVNSVYFESMSYNINITDANIRMSSNDANILLARAIRKCI